MTEGLKPESPYTDSPRGWTRDAPKRWRTRKLREILRIISRRNRPDLPLLSVVREQGVILRDISNKVENHNYIPDDLTNYKVVQRGNFVVNKMKAWQGSYGVSEHDGIVSPAYFVFVVNGVNPDYFHMAIRSKAYVPSFTRESDGVRIGQWDLSMSGMREIEFLIPPDTVQADIVRFLEHADKRIRRYIDAKQKLIALLEEQRQAGIHQAITGQIDVRNGKAYGAYKESEVDWLGKLASHWDIRRLRNIGEAIIGLTYDPQNVVGQEDGLLVLRASNIQEGRVVDADNVFVRQTVPSRLLTQTGDILLCTRSGSRALIGKNARIDATSAGVTFGAFMTIFRGPHNDYIHQVFNSRLFEYQSGAFLTSTINQLTLEMLHSIRVPWPPTSEQKKIVEYLKRMDIVLSKTIANCRQEIRRMREFHARLLVDVVTGKLDVRTAAEALPETKTY